MYSLRNEYRFHSETSSIDGSVKYNSHVDVQTLRRNSLEPHSTHMHGKYGSDYDYISSDTMPLNREIAFAQWRSNYKKSRQLWTKGGWRSYSCRFLFCSVMVLILTLSGVIMSLALFARPPRFVVSHIVPILDSQKLFSVNSTSLGVQFGANITVDNPNYFTIVLPSVITQLTYPINKTPIGLGSKADIVFHSNSRTEIFYPISILYEVSKDPAGLVINDIISRCDSNDRLLEIDLEVTVSIKVLFITARPKILAHKSIACPVSGGDIRAILQGAQISAPS